MAISNIQRIKTIPLPPVFHRSTQCLLFTLLHQARNKGSFVTKGPKQTMFEILKTLQAEIKGAKFVKYCNNPQKTEEALLQDLATYGIGEDGPRYSSVAELANIDALTDYLSNRIVALESNLNFLISANCKNMADIDKQEEIPTVMEDIQTAFTVARLLEDWFAHNPAMLKQAIDNYVPATTIAK